MEQTPRPGEFYRHFKNNLYQVLTVADHAETGERMVVYQALYGAFRVYVRPLAMFFDPVDRERYPEAVQNLRFERVEPEAGEVRAGEVREEENGPAPHPLLLRFLEAEGTEAQLGALNQMRGKIGQRELDSIYVVLDIPPAEGTAEEQLAGIVRTLEMRRKYDGSRLR